MDLISEIKPQDELYIQQTPMTSAVDWLINEIDMQYPDINVKWKQWMIDRAKQMEKEQIMEAYKSADECVLDSDKIAEEYYNKTYGKE